MTEKIFSQEYSNEEAHILFYDGFCGLCNGAVRFILTHESRHTLKFSSLQSGFAQAIIKQNLEVKTIDSLLFLSNGEIFTRSDAVCKSIEYLGGIWKVLLFFRLLPKPVRNWMYDLIAKYRYSIFGKYDTCLIPDKNVLSRFIE